MVLHPFTNLVLDEALEFTALGFQLSALGSGFNALSGPTCFSALSSVTAVAQVTASLQLAIMVS